MKKSAFVILLLSVFISIFSSFKKTTPKAFLVNRWETFGVTPNSVNGAPYTSTAIQIYGGKISDDFSCLASSLSQANLLNLFNVNSYILGFNLLHFPSSVSCGIDTQHICVATIAYYNSMPNSVTIVDYNYGDYTYDGI